MPRWHWGTSITLSSSSSDEDYGCDILSHEQDGPKKFVAICMLMERWPCSEVLIELFCKGVSKLERVQSLAKSSYKWGRAMLSAIKFHGWLVDEKQSVQSLVGWDKGRARRYIEDKWMWLSTTYDKYSAVMEHLTPWMEDQTTLTTRWQITLLWVSM